MADDPHETDDPLPKIERRGGARPGAGRPSSYTDAIADEICLRLSEGEALRVICRDDHMPDRMTVLRWEDANFEFAAKCARARAWQGEWIVDDMASVEAGVLTGMFTPEQAKVAISSKQWRAAKLAPKRFGDKISHEHAGPDGGPVKSEVMVQHGADEAFAAVVAALDGAGRTKASGGSETS